LVPIEQNAVLQLGVPEMDQTHEEFVTHIQNLIEASDEEVLSRLDELFAHTQSHFAQETSWMESMNFAQLGCHRVEHDGVLAVMQEAKKYVEQGKFEVGRVLARELAEWFRNHAVTMDAMLAYAMRTDGAELAACSTGACEH